MNPRYLSKNREEKRADSFRCARLGKMSGEWCCGGGVVGVSLRRSLSITASCTSVPNVCGAANFNNMLSRRIFRELTDSILLGPGYRSAIASCEATRWPTRCACDRRIGHPIRSSSSSTRWKSRQGKDFFAREARVQGLKSRAAFKLLEV